MTDTPSRRPGNGGVTAALHEHVAKMREVAEAVACELPPEFQGEAFRILARHLLGAGPAPTGAAAPRATAEPAPARALGLDLAHLELDRYAVLLAGPGRTLLKALAALEIAADQLGIDWLSPAEIERLLSERARVQSIYRTNVSNALRGARQLADRRRRGRGYEYHITLRGREALERERSILGA